MTERLDRRSGVEGPDGQSRVWRHQFYGVRRHAHYCAEHDHYWTCRQDPCLQHDAVDCIENLDRFDRESR